MDIFHTFLDTEKSIWLYAPGVATQITLIVQEPLLDLW